MTTGDAILAKAKEHLGEPYIFGARAPMANATWRGPWDCAEFASWIVYHATGILYGAEPEDNPMLADAYTGFWAEHSYDDGTRIPIEKAVTIPGAMLLRIPDHRTGHIAISDGEGGTVEAHSRARGVTTAHVAGRRWDCGVLVPGVAYGQGEREMPTPYKPPCFVVLRLTWPLMRGNMTRKVQSVLVQAGFHPGAIDGIYGPQTAWAVKQFQADRGLVVDGEVGPQTREAMGISAGG